MANIKRDRAKSHTGAALWNIAFDGIQDKLQFTTLQAIAGHGAPLLRAGLQRVDSVLGAWSQCGVVSRINKQVESRLHQSTAKSLDHSRPWSTSFCITPENAAAKSDSLAMNESTICLVTGSAYSAKSAANRPSRDMLKDQVG